MVRVIELRQDHDSGTSIAFADLSSNALTPSRTMRLSSARNAVLTIDASWVHECMPCSLPDRLNLHQQADAHHEVVLARRAKRADTLGGAAPDVDDGIDRPHECTARRCEEYIMTTTLIEHPADTRRMWNRIAGFAGIAAVVLFLALAVGISASAPVFTDGADELRSWFADNEGPVAFFVWIAPLVFGFLQLAFAVGLLRRLGEDDTSGGILPRLAFAGAVAGFGAGVVGMSLFGVMTLEPVRDASDDVLLTLSALDSVVFFVLIPWTTAMYVIFASVLMLQTRAMPFWLAGLGCFAGLVSVVGGTWVFSGDPAGGVAVLGLLGGLAVFIWTLIASVLLIRSATA